MNYSEIESKVREATSDDPWGPSGQLMGEIAKYVKLTHTHSYYRWSVLYITIITYTIIKFYYEEIKALLEGHIRLHRLYRHYNIFDCPFVCRSTFMYEQFPEVMNMLWTRMLKDNKKNWRRVYKVSLHTVFFLVCLYCMCCVVLCSCSVLFI